jgi:tRNA-Thr(GGU) m(6)t(6)A37 methyltransferase TsaA
MKVWLFSTALASAGLLLGLASVVPSDGAKEEEFFRVYAIGLVHKSDGRTFIEMHKKYEEGLLGLDGFSHVQVFWWFSKNDIPQKRAILRVYPRGDPANPLTGVFATRAPVRPNLIALTTCKILSVEGRRVYLDSIDAFDGTPVIDLKPYVPGLDQVKQPRVPDWARRGRQ